MFGFIRILFFALFILWLVRSVVSFAQRFLAGAQPRTPVQRPHPQQAQTLLQQDPVCGTYVSVESSLKRLHDGRVIHFCSPECRDRYAV